MKYFLRISMSYSCKNKAQKEASKMITEYKNTLITSSRSLAAIKTEIALKLEKINTHHKRCGDIELITHLPGKTSTSCSVIGSRHTVELIVIHKIIKEI